MDIIKIVKRILALFFVSAFTTIGAGAILGMDTVKTAALAGILGIANVLEDLARGYINDGILSQDEIDAAFNNNTPTEN